MEGYPGVASSSVRSTAIEAQCKKTVFARKDFLRGLATISSYLAEADLQWPERSPQMPEHISSFGLAMTHLVVSWKKGASKRHNKPIRAVAYGTGCGTLLDKEGSSRISSDQLNLVFFTTEDALKVLEANYCCVGLSGVQGKTPMFEALNDFSDDWLECRLTREAQRRDSAAYVRWLGDNCDLKILDYVYANVEDRWQKCVMNHWKGPPMSSGSEDLEEYRAQPLPDQWKEGYLADYSDLSRQDIIFESDKLVVYAAKHDFQLAYSISKLGPEPYKGNSSFRRVTKEKAKAKELTTAKKLDHEKYAMLIEERRQEEVSARMWNQRFSVDLLRRLVVSQSKGTRPLRRSEVFKQEYPFTFPDDKVTNQINHSYRAKYGHNGIE
ncbi:hypothetical protein CPC08DRAFT_820709 [Agrocybe pediades]|nr:hypothetical protein CPC08DRAFT_820709 [Agrocybe pediades]